jgi:hypothetical protein
MTITANKTRPGKCEARKSDHGHSYCNRPATCNAQGYGLCGIHLETWHEYHAAGGIQAARIRITTGKPFHKQRADGAQVAAVQERPWRWQHGSE